MFRSSRDYIWNKMENLQERSSTNVNEGGCRKHASRNKSPLAKTYINIFTCLLSNPEKIILLRRKVRPNERYRAPGMRRQRSGCCTVSLWEGGPRYKGIDCKQDKHLVSLISKRLMRRGRCYRGVWQEWYSRPLTVQGQRTSGCPYGPDPPPFYWTWDPIMQQRYWIHN